MRELHETLLPAIALCRTAGLVPYTMEKGRVRLSKAAAAWSGICLLAQFVVAVLMPYALTELRRRSEAPHNVTGPIPAWKFPSYSVNTAAGVIGCFCVIGTLFLDLAKNERHYATILQHLSFADKMLSLDLSTTYQKYRKSLKVRAVITIFLILVFYSWYMVTLEGHWNHVRGITIIVQTLPISMSIFWIMTVSLAVRQRLSAFNQHLAAFRVKYFRSTLWFLSNKEEWNACSTVGPPIKFDASVHTVSSYHSGSDMINVLRVVYNSICVVMGSLVQSYQFFVALELMCLFGCANVNVFGVMGADPNWQSRLSMLFVNILHLLSLVVPGHLIGLEVDYSLEQVCQLLSVEPVEGRLMKELRQLAWQLRCRKPQMRMAGLITVDLRLLVGFVTTLVTYVVLLYTFSY